MLRAGLWFARELRSGKHEDSPYDGWMDVNGSPYTRQAKFTERFRRPTFGTLEIDPPSREVRVRGEVVDLAQSSGQVAVQEADHPTERFGGGLDEDAGRFANVGAGQHVVKVDMATMSDDVTATGDPDGTTT